MRGNEEKNLKRSGGKFIRKIWDHFTSWVLLYIVLILSVIFVTKIYIITYDKDDKFIQVDAVITDKFIWDYDTEQKTYTNGKTTITVDSSVYNINIYSKDTDRWFEVTKDEYDNLQIGDFVYIWERIVNDHQGGDYRYLQLNKDDDIFDTTSEGELLKAKDNKD